MGSDQQDPTRRWSENEPTVAVGAQPGAPGIPPPDAPADDDDPTRGRGRREFLIGLAGAVIGFALALVVVALTTGGAEVDEDLATHLASLEEDLETRDARIAELEAQLDEAEAAAGGRESDIELQRQALDDRADVLDEWEQRLSEREAQAAQREAAVAERERDADTDTPIIDTDDIIDDETVDNIVERVIDGIRNLFGR